MRMKCQVDLCDNVVTQIGAQLVCKSCYRFAHKERKRMVYVCHDAKLDLKGIVTHPNLVKHCAQREFVESELKACTRV